MGKSGIYMIHNITTDEKYIGQTNDFDRRFYEHKQALRNGTACNKHLQRSWNKYGEDAFIFSVIEYCDIESLNQREIYWISFYDCHRHGFNQTDGGDGCRGYQPPPEVCKKISDGLKGKKKSKEHIEKIRNNTIEYLKTHENPNSKHVICLNTGEEFNSYALACKKYGISSASHIGKCISGELKSAGKLETGEKLVWVSQDQYISMGEEDIQKKLEAPYEKRSMPPDIGDRISNALIGKKKSKAHVDKMRIAAKEHYEKYGSATNKKIICLNTLKTYDSAAKAEIETGIPSGSIRRCCNGELLTAGALESGERLVWVDYDKYATMSDDDIDNMLKRQPKRFTRSVICLTTGKVYNSINEAHEDTGANINRIIACCRGRAKRAGNFEWAYYDNKQTPNDSLIVA